MTKLLLALCAAAGGLLAGLLIASLCSESLTAVVAQRDGLIENVRTLQAKNQQLTERLEREVAEENQHLQEKLQQTEAEISKPPQVARLPQKPKTAAAWHTLWEWMIRGSKATETFHVDAPTWRLSWETDGEFGVTILVFRANGEAVTGVNGVGLDSSIVRAAPGTFYLNVLSIAPEESRIAVEVMR